MNIVNITFRLACVLFISTILVNKLVYAKSPINKKELSHTIENALSKFHTPGMAVGIVHKNKLVLSQGYGLASVSDGENGNIKADASTYFRLASTSKAFTSAALAILVDEGKLSWKDKVIEHLPEFALYDPYVTREFTITDLLTHRSGLLSGAGDSMIWPEPSGFTRQELIHNLRYLRPEYSFRAKYAYSNVMYITAGELIAKVSGMDFDHFVEQRVFKPLGMNCFVGDIPKLALKNVAMGYSHNDSRGIYAIPRNGITEKGLMSAAAGGMVCNVEGMNKWLQALLSKENLPFSETQLYEMWRSHTILSVSKNERNWDETLFKSYGLGWRLSNLGKLKMISHTGTLSGYQAYVVLVPKLELGVVILNNGSNSAARGSVMQTIVKAYVKDAGFTHEELDLDKIDWVETYIDYLDEREQAYLGRYEKPIATAPMSIKPEQVVGEYTDKWFGTFTISAAEPSNTESNLRIQHSKMKTLVGSLIPFQDATYKIEWDNKNAAGEAFISFSLNVKRDIVSATLRPFSVNEVVNHEYRDMVFYKALAIENDTETK